MGRVLTALRSEGHSWSCIIMELGVHGDFDKMHMSTTWSGVSGVKMVKDKAVLFGSV